MAIFIQQDGDNLVISKEIIPLFSVKSVRLVRVMDGYSEVYEFKDLESDLYIQDDLKQSAIYELQVPLFGFELPIDRVYFNNQDFEKQWRKLPPLKKREISSFHTNQVRESEKEFYRKVKENVEHVLG